MKKKNSNKSSHSEKGKKLLGTEPKLLGTEFKRLGTEPKSLGTEFKRLGTELKPLGTELKRLGTEPKPLGTEARGLGTEVSGIWHRQGTETGMLKLDMQPGKKQPLKPGEQRTMKVRLSKATVKGKPCLKLTLEG